MSRSCTNLPNSKCALPCCNTPAKSSCSRCEREHYCSSCCQKLDWRVHKSMCPVLKKLSTKQLSFYDAYDITGEILNSTNGENTRILKHLLSFAEFQFNKKVIGTVYPERGEESINWTVDFLILHHINSRLFGLSQDNSLSSISIAESIFPYLERSLSLLNPYLIHFDSNTGSNSLNEVQLEELLEELICTEQRMLLVTMNRNQFDVAEGHCQRSLAYSRRIRLEGEKKTTSIFEALGYYSDLRERQCNLSDAIIFAEECYNLVVEAYDCVHPQVQVAAGKLISILIRNRDFHDALRFAEVTYSNLRDKKNGMDQEGGEIATGAYNLADVIYRQRGDLTKAEELARESLRIRTRLNGSNCNSVGVSSLLLAHILRVQNNLGDETKELFERTLNIFVIDEGPDSINAAIGNLCIGQFYHELAEVEISVDLKRRQLLKSQSYFEEAFRIQSKDECMCFTYAYREADFVTYML